MSLSIIYWPIHHTDFRKEGRKQARLSCRTLAPKVDIIEIKSATSLKARGLAERRIVLLYSTDSLRSLVTEDRNMQCFPCREAQQPCFRSGAAGLPCGYPLSEERQWYHLATIRAFNGCTGLLFGWCIMCSNASACSRETLTGSFITIHRTPSVQGGVVSDPSYR